MKSTTSALTRAHQGLVIGGIASVLIMWGIISVPVAAQSAPTPQAASDISSENEREAARVEYEKKKAELSRLQRELDAAKIEQRKAFARQYENQMLDRNLNFEVETEGDDATRLIIRWAPIDRVFIRKFDKNTRFWSKVRALGFKTVTTVGSSVTGNRELN